MMLLRAIRPQLCPAVCVCVCVINFCHRGGSRLSSSELSGNQKQTVGPDRQLDKICDLTEFPEMKTEQMNVV